MKKTFSERMAGALEQAAKANPRLGLSQIIALYFSAARYREIREGVTLQFRPHNTQIEITYFDRQISIPILDFAEAELAEKLFAGVAGTTYTLKGTPQLINNKLRKLNLRYNLASHFNGQRLNPSFLRACRIYSFGHDYMNKGITEQQAWALFFAGKKGSWDRHFDSGEIMQKAKLAVAGIKGTVLED